MNRSNSYHSTYSKRYNKSRFYKKPYKRVFIKDKFAEQYPYNNYIKYPRLLVIDETGKNLGEMDTLTAKSLAREKDLDLVVIAPKAKIPVAKIVDLNSFKYQIQKKEKLIKKSQKKNKVKEIKFSPLIAEGDLQRKIEKIKSFTSKGYTVKVTVMRKRRITKENFDAFYNKLLTLMKNCCNILNTQTKGRDAHMLVKYKQENAKDQNIKNIKEESKVNS